MSARVTAMMQQRKLFPWLLEKPLRMDGVPPYLRDQDGRTIYRMYHFSCYGGQMEVLNRQVAQIRRVVEAM